MSGTNLGSLFDRVGVTLAGSSIIGGNPAYVILCNAEIDGQLVAVDGFSANRLVTGFVTGNKHYAINLELSLINSSAPPLLDQIDYDASNIQLTLTAAVGNYLTSNSGNVYNGGWMMIFSGSAWGSGGWNFSGSGQNARMSARFMAQSMQTYTPI